MSRSKATPPSVKHAKTYAYGALRQTLVNAARGLVIESGVEALNLREVARRAGVTTGAPYYHFKDKAELTSALAQESLNELDRLSQEAQAGETQPREKLRALGVAYVMYAVEHPALFRLMFRPELGSSFGAQGKSAPVFRVLNEVVEALQEAQGIRGDPDAFAISAWSLVHGLAALLIDGPLQHLSKDPRRVEALAKQVTENLDLSSV